MNLDSKIKFPFNWKETSGSKQDRHTVAKEREGLDKSELMRKSQILKNRKPYFILSVGNKQQKKEVYNGKATETILTHPLLWKVQENLL